MRGTIDAPTLARTRRVDVGSVTLAFLSAGLLIVGTVLGVLAGMLRVLEAAEADYGSGGEPR